MKTLKLSPEYLNFINNSKYETVDIKLIDGSILDNVVVESDCVIVPDNFEINLIKSISNNKRKRYKSQIDYNKSYNERSATIQISKELHQDLKEFLKDKNLTIRQWIEDLIKIEINER